MSPFHSLSASSLRGQNIALADYAGKVVVVVNTASKCGFTPQYDGLEALYQKYKDQGLVILGFPCNQFGKQEPGGVTEIEQTCRINYGVSFPMFAKVEVNGANAHPLFGLLTKALPGVFGAFLPRIKWNFTKFLIDSEGKVIDRYAPATRPDELVDAIEALLQGPGSSRN